MKRYACPQCDYMAYQEICVKRHIARKHEQLRHLACPHCDYRFGLETRLNEHLRDTHKLVMNIKEFEKNYAANKTTDLKRM